LLFFSSLKSGSFLRSLVVISSSDDIFSKLGGGGLTFFYDKYI
jgi:hypothetical protein